MAAHGQSLQQRGTGVGQQRFHEGRVEVGPEPHQARLLRVVARASGVGLERPTARYGHTEGSQRERGVPAPGLRSRPSKYHGR